MTQHYDEIENRIWFLKRVIGPDDVYDFLDLLLQMNSILSLTLEKYSNLDTITEENEIVEKVIKNILEIRLKMIYKDYRIIDIEKFTLKEPEK